MLHARSEFAVYILILIGLMGGCLVLSGWLGLTAWADVLLVIKLTGFVTLAGLAMGVFAESLVGRCKTWQSNVLGIVLVALTLLGMGAPAIQVYFDPASTTSTGGKSIGLVLSSFLAGGGAELGRHLVRRVLIRGQQAGQTHKGEQ